MDDLQEMGVLKVTEFNNAIKQHLNTLGSFSVEGEITELKISPNKGVHITLSDKTSNLKLTGFAPRIRGLNLVEKGMVVIAKGTPTIYTPYGNFSLEIFQLEPQGEGALKSAYQKLKLQLESEGLFDIKRKQSLPSYITKVALLTGHESAAYSDFVKILKENSQNLVVDFYPVLVQGSNSVDDINATLDYIFNSSKYYDVIVLTRGGGSLEDLKSFNDEQIVRKIFNSRYRFIVGVGHEVDESLCDFVADIRASTPSQAAYYIVSQNAQFIDSLDSQITALDQKLQHTISQYKAKIEYSEDKIINYITTRYMGLKTDLEIKERLLESYNVKKVLQRGYALVEGVGSLDGKEKAKVIKSVRQTYIKQKVRISFSDGNTIAQVIEETASELQTNLALENSNLTKRTFKDSDNDSHQNSNIAKSNDSLQGGLFG